VKEKGERERERERELYDVGELLNRKKVVELPDSLSTTVSRIQVV